MDLPSLLFGPILYLPSQQSSYGSPNVNSHKTYIPFI